MREIVQTSRFKKELKIASKRGCNIENLRTILKMLVNDEPLPERCHDHNLSGRYEGYSECHIEPDWLLVYRKDNEKLYLILYRTGTHSDLF